ncbi:hypothetical protein [Azospirillum endophyticum]
MNAGNRQWAGTRRHDRSPALNVPQISSRRPPFVAQAG